MSMHIRHGPSSSTIRGSTKLLFIGMLIFSGLVLYVLVATHHLKLPTSFAALTHAMSPGVEPHLRGTALDTNSAQALFQKHDVNKDARLDQAEFSNLLADMLVKEGAGAASKQLTVPPRMTVISSPAAQGSKLSQMSAAASSKTTVAISAAATAAAEAATRPATAAAPPAAATAAKPPAAAQQTAPGMCPELSKELVQSFARNSTIMLTVCDWRIFETFGINWMKHLKKAGVDYFLVGATDRKTSEFLSSSGQKHPCFKFFEDGAGTPTTSEYKYGSEHYRLATWRKVTVVQKIVDWGFNVLHSDVDVVWFRDPLPYVLGPRMEHPDIAISTDLISTGNEKGDDGLEVHCHQQVNFNTGIYFVKATPGGQRFMKEWAGLRATFRDNDQVGLYYYVRNRPAKVDTKKRVLLLDNDAIAVGLLSVSMALNGYSYFIPQLHKAQKVDPLVIHMTWLPLSREGKFSRMRDGMLYHDPPEYYTGPMLMTADLDLPTAPEGYNAWQDTEKMIQFHMKAMDQQLVQVYRVMAVAVILNRTLVLPKMHCFCYKNWFMMEQCRIPGDKVTQFPMECALDQWLRPKVVYNYGPNITGKDGPRPFLFREHTMLDNPSFPAELRKQEVVLLPHDGKGVVAKGKLLDGRQQALVPKGLKQEQLVQALKQFKDVKILRFKRIEDIFAGFDDMMLKESFEYFVDKVAGNWCCRDKPFIAKGMKEKEKLAIHW